VTEEDEIHGLKREKRFAELMAATGSRCRIARMSEVLNS